MIKELKISLNSILILLLFLSNFKTICQIKLPELNFNSQYSGLLIYKLPQKINISFGNEHLPREKFGNTYYPSKISNKTWANIKFEINSNSGFAINYLNNTEVDWFEPLAANSINFKYFYTKKIGAKSEFLISPSLGLGRHYRPASNDEMPCVGCTKTFNEINWITFFGGAGLSFKTERFFLNYASPNLIKPSLNILTSYGSSTISRKIRFPTIHQIFAKYELNFARIVKIIPNFSLSSFNKNERSSNFVVGFSVKDKNSFFIGRRVYFDNQYRKERLGFTNLGLNLKFSKNVSINYCNEFKFDEIISSSFKKFNLHEFGLNITFLNFTNHSQN